MNDEEIFQALMMPVDNYNRAFLSAPSGPPGIFPTLSWTSSDFDLIAQMKLAKDGVMLLSNLNIKVPMAGARETFCKLYQEPGLANEQINKLHQPRGLYKNKAFMDKSIDQKIVLDLGPTDIAQIHDKNLLAETGFNEVIDFYNTLQEQVLPRLLGLVSCAIVGYGYDFSGKPLSSRVVGIHCGKNYKLRLVDYFPVHSSSQRCGEHRDYTTFTLIFQDGSQGGLEIFSNDSWVPIPPENQIVMMWGWSTFIMSNGRMPAPLHRVVTPKAEKYRKAPRRNEMAFFVSPDWNAYLFPYFNVPNEAIAFNIDSIKDLTMQSFKTRFGLKWHQREGTTVPQEEIDSRAVPKDEVAKTQDDVIVEFLFGKSK